MEHHANIVPWQRSVSNWSNHRSHPHTTRGIWTWKHWKTTSVGWVENLIHMLNIKYFGNGKSDLEITQLAHRNNTLVVVDGAQAFHMKNQILKT